MAVLVVAEHDNTSLKGGTLAAVTAARALQAEVHLAIAGYQCQKVADASRSIEGVARLRVADDALYKDYLAENLAPLIAGIARGYSHILAPSGTFGKDVMPRVAALLDVAQLSDIIAILSPDTFKRPIYAGSAVATVQSRDAVKVLTVRATAFEKARLQGGDATVEPLEAGKDSGLSSLIGRELTASGERPELTGARIVVSGGRGLGSAENFKMLERLADRLGAAVGASRAAVDAGFVPNDYQVGQTGKVVAPELYIAVGISGAIQHIAGMRDSKVIVAINKDENAPIFEVADYGLVMDLFEAVPALENCVVKN